MNKIYQNITNHHLHLGKSWKIIKKNQWFTAVSSTCTCSVTSATCTRLCRTKVAKASCGWNNCRADSICSIHIYKTKKTGTICIKNKFGSRYIPILLVTVLLPVLKQLQYKKKKCYPFFYLSRSELKEATKMNMNLKPC